MRSLNIGIISQARMTSTRLPGKVLLNINNKPILGYHCDRLIATEIPVYIATTTNSADDKIVDFCFQNNIAYYRGTEYHVLSRYHACAAQNNLDVIIRVTSDCPLLDPKVIRTGLDVYLTRQDKNLYVSNVLERTYPRGFDFEIFSFSLLDEAYKRAVLPGDIEHVTPYIHQNRSGLVQFAHITRPEDKSQYRITLDTSEDFELIQQLIQHHHANTLSADQIIRVLDQHPELVRLNAHIEQKKA